MTNNKKFVRVIKQLSCVLKKDMQILGKGTELRADTEADGVRIKNN